MYFGAPPPEFSTLLEVTEAVTMYVHGSCYDLLGVPPFFWVLRGNNGD